MDSNISLIILAGGKATRFQQKGKPWIDKLLISNEAWGDRPLLIHVIKKFRKTISSILVVTNAVERRKKYRELIKRHEIPEIQIVLDRQIKCVGPLKGLYSGIKEVHSEQAFVLAGDLPFMEPSLLDYLNRMRGDSNLAFFLNSRGSLESLVISLHVGTVSKFLDVLCYFNKRR
ncbi:MAG: molybdenum cofactor guanylyltransferase, partial [Candidatus Helarchaeales archaeon]